MKINRKRDNEKMKKTIQDDVFGKITYNDGKWVGKEPVKFTVCGKTHDIKLEVESVSEIYDEINLGIMDKTIADIIMKNSNVCNEEEALKKKEQQKALYNSIMANLSEVEKNIEEAAVQELEEVIQDYNEETFGKKVGKDKAVGLFAASSREEKLESLKLKVMRVFLDRIEIKCTCDWYKYGGGFIVLENGECIMRQLDSLSF